ncbi:MAG: D-glutamate deacylase [Acidobacteria bacterium]|nr:MAG: D-glutamate deacylase [Acidobacteriota bacterium]
MPLALPLGLFLLVAAAAPERYDVVLRGGRVMDPETGLDAVRDVGIRGDAIARISAEPLAGARVLDARGLVVAPGFIDLHQHQQDAAAYRLKALDGVTTALELEIGVPDVARFLSERAGRSLIHHGAAASHPAARVAVLGAPLPAGAVVPPAGPATDTPASPEQVARIRDTLRAELLAGGLGIGMGIAYTPGATRAEVIETFRLAGERRVPVFTHVRSSGRVEPGSSIEAVAEVIAAAAVTGASLHVVHINSSGARDALECLALVEGARARGLDVTTEAYPYGAGMTAINSAIFNPGWREKMGLDYADLELPDSGERLTRERFEALHAAPEPRLVLVHVNPDAIVDAVIRHPLVMIASDGLGPHPRNAGTYARVLSRYVRAQQSLTLMDALRKMTLLPARRLETATAAARRKGRLQEGADADVVVFDAASIADRATYRSPAEPSVGVRFLLVAGTLVVDAGRIVDGVVPGRGLTSDRGTPAR